MKHKFCLIITVAGFFFCAGVGRCALASSPLVIHRNICFAEPEGIRLLADIYRPKDRADEANRLPGVLMIHGGAWMSGSKLNVGNHAMKLAKRGYVVMAIDYRLAPRHKFPAQLEDCQSALRWLADHAEEYQADPARLAVYGYSAGGHLACLMAVRQAVGGQYEERKKGERGPPIRAVVAGGAPCEFRLIPQQSSTLAYWLGGTRAELPDVYRDASPTAFVSEKVPPVFFFHGDKDGLVPIESPRRLQRALAQQNVQCEMHVVKGGGHLTTYFDRESMNKAGEFLDKVLLRNDADFVSRPARQQTESIDESSVDPAARKNVIAP